MERRSMVHLRKVCRVLSIAFVIVLLFCAIALAFVIGIAVMMIMDPNYVNPTVTREALPWALFYRVMLCFALASCVFALYKVTDSIGGGKSPFIEGNVRALKMMACACLLFFVITVLEYVLLWAFNVNGVDIGVDYGFLLTALIVYALALIFQYGTDLQDESDSFV